VAVAGVVPLAGYYLLHFTVIGVTLPFLPAYFRSLGLSGTQIGLLLALQPLLALVAPPFWGHVADRTGRPDRVLSAIALGSVACFAPLLWLRRFDSLALAYAGYAFFASSMTMVIVSLTLHRVAATGESYARIRLFGSVGFVLSSAAFGALAPEVDRRVVMAALAMMGVTFAWSFVIRSRTAPSEGAHPLAGLSLLRHRDVAVLLACTCLHWIACAPFHGSFAIHVTALGLPPAVVGLSAGLGVVAEIVVMLTYPRLLGRLPPQLTLALACGISALRWLLMSVVERPVPMVLLQVLHGMTFGAFYTASVSYLAGRVPAALRASGQALYVAVTFGLGGLAGFTAAGAGYDLLGGHRLFLVAAGVELVPALLILSLKAPGIPGARPPS
jgi:PPP family 3-phenylpropionic acid transporter